MDVLGHLIRRLEELARGAAVEEEEREEPTEEDPIEEELDERKFDACEARARGAAIAGSRRPKGNKRSAGAPRGGTEGGA